MPQPIPDPAESRRHTVSELLGLLRSEVEANWANIWVVGEISNLAQPASGHLYFSLADENGRLKSVMFRGFARQLGFEPSNGLQVLARGTITLYAPRGDLQLAVQFMEPLGDGSLRLRFEQLKTRLAAEGLFDENRKRPLPAYPRRVGLVTSPSGAALQDVLKVLRRRAPGLEVVLAPCLVQGARAAAEIAAAIDGFSEQRWVDVVVVTRGGGSLEDLQPFNEELTARAVARCSIPVISAVGHETDVTICDFAADHRAPTPSAAAEMVSARYEDLVERLAATRQRLRSALGARMARAAMDLQRAAPGRLGQKLRLRIFERAQGVDEIQARQVNSLGRTLGEGRRRLTRLEALLARHNPGRQLERRRSGLSALTRELGVRITRRLQRAGSDTHRLRDRLGALSPLAVLERGYAICRRAGGPGTVVRDTRQVRAGDRVTVLLHRGELGCRVDETRGGSRASAEVREPGDG
jgi:exodeoxyribonuclease VII large subunit